MAKLSGDNTLCIVLPDLLHHLHHLWHLHYLHHLQHSPHQAASAVRKRFTEIIIPYVHIKYYLFGIKKNYEHDIDNRFVF